MPQPRKPTALHIAKGSYAKNPQRAKARENEPVVHDPIGTYPVAFLPRHDDDRRSELPRLRAIWDELIGDAAPGVLNRSHRFHLEATCQIMYTIRFGRPKTGDFGNLNKYLTQMGMNPAAQSTVSGGAFTPAGGSSSIGSLAARAQARRAG